MSLELRSADRPTGRSVLSRLLLRTYRVPALRYTCVRVALRTEGGNFRSATLRDILREYHGVEVGDYSYGGCLRPGAFPPGVVIGRYVSTAGNVFIYRRNHPLDHPSLHPFFYNPRLGVVSEDGIETAPLRIDHDAWIGDRAIILPGCRSIGIGAVVGAGSVVTHDVPDFAVVGGAPAKTLKMRFPPEVRAEILKSRWWERTIEELTTEIDTFTAPVGPRGMLKATGEAPR